jgi:hypothetical protein
MLGKKKFSLKIEKANTLNNVILEGTEYASRGRWQYRGVEGCLNIGHEWSNCNERSTRRGTKIN